MSAAAVPASPPTVPESPALQTARWMLRPIAFMESCRRRLGDAFTVRFVGADRPMTLISDPEAIRALYTDPRHGLPPARSAPLAPLIGPESVLLMTGQEHLDRRKLMAPAFHGERMRSSEEIVREVCEREAAGWPAGEPLQLHPRMRAITLEVVLRAVFGIADPERYRRLGEMLARLLNQASDLKVSLRIVAAHRLPVSPLPGDLLARIAEIDDLLLGEIAERRRGDSDRDDFMSMLIEARFEDGGGMEDREIRDQLVTMMLAGYETTAAALAWSFDLVVRHPDVVERLVAGEGDGEYARAVVRESLRLRPVLSFVGRRLGAELEVGDYVLPAGANVAPAAWLTHTRADLYPEPYAFRPERFLDLKPATYGWVPFGGGVRRCIGGAFAELEMRIVLETILRQRTLRPLRPLPEPISRRNLMLAPRHGTLVEAA